MDALLNLPSIKIMCCGTCPSSELPENLSKGLQVVESAVAPEGVVTALRTTICFQAPSNGEVAMWYREGGVLGSAGWRQVVRFAI